MATPTFYTVKEVANMLKYTTDHIHRLVREGELPHYRMGKAVRITPDQLNEWLESKRVYTKAQITRFADTRAIAK